MINDLFRKWVLYMWGTTPRKFSEIFLTLILMLMVSSIAFAFGSAIISVIVDAIGLVATLIFLLTFGSIFAILYLLTKRIQKELHSLYNLRNKGHTL